MAEIETIVGNNFAKDEAHAPTSYLDLTGLSKFWEKVKGYVDESDTILRDKAKKYIDDKDDAVRSYIESLTINGHSLDKKDGSSLEVTIDGAEIEAGDSAGKYAGKNGEGDDAPAYTVSSSLGDIDTRLNAAEKSIGENVINKIDVVDTPKTETDPTTPNYVKFTKETSGDPKNGNYTVTLTVDETELDTKIADIDDAIVELEANAGVAGIRILDTPEEVGEGGAKTAENYVKFDIATTKVNDKSDVTVEDEAGNVYHKSLITLTVDETALDEKFRGVDGAIEAEVKNRKADVLALAGGNSKIEGDQLVIDQDLTYKSIAEIDEYIETNENNLKNLTPTEGTGDDAGKKVLTVNGHTLIKSDVSGTQVSMEGSSIVLTGEDIVRVKGNSKTIAEVLQEHDNKFAAFVSATEFVGVVEWDPTNVVIEAGDADAAGLPSYNVYAKGSDGKKTGESLGSFQNGDIVLKQDGKEYILDAKQLAFVELGDTTAEGLRLDAIENWINTQIIQPGDIESLFTGNNVVRPNFEGLVDPE